MRTDTLFDIEYGYWFNQLNESLFRRLDFLTNLIQLVGGSAAAFAALQSSPVWLVGSGMALALCAAVQLLVQPAVQAEHHRACKQQWRSIKATQADLSDAQLLQAVATLQGTGPSGSTWLAVPAFNATVRATGNVASVSRLSLMQAIASRLA